MKLVKIRSREDLAWTRSLLSASAPSAMWAIEQFPSLMVGCLSSVWKIYVQPDVERVAFPEEHLSQLLSQEFACRAEALCALEDFYALYSPAASLAMPGRHEPGSG